MSRTIIILVAERTGEVIGYTYAGVEGNDYMALRGPAGVMYDIVVDPGHRQQGVAAGGCSTRRSRRSRPEVRPALYSRRQSGTRRRSACSIARGSGAR